MPVAETVVACGSTEGKEIERGGEGDEDEGPSTVAVSSASIAQQR